MALLFSGCFAQTLILPNQANQDYSAQNSGKTGLIEMPNARVMEDWHVRPFWSYGDPFIYYGVAIAPLPRVEINLRMTQVQGISGFSDSDGYGQYKDKAIDLKVLLSKEDRILPAIAIGFDDIHGTALYASKYIVATKRIDFIDLSAGYALGRIGGEDLRKYGTNFNDDRGIDFLTSTDFGGGSFFGGIEAHLTPELTLKAEYSPIDYRLDNINPFNTGMSDMPKTDINIGLKYKLTDKLTLSANAERGNSMSFGVNMTIPFRDQALYDHAPDPKWRATQGTKERFASQNDANLSDTIANEIVAERYSNVQVAVNERKVWASVENPKYNSNMKALGRVADIIDEVTPERVDDLYLSLKQSDLEYAVLHLRRDEIKKLKADKQAELAESAIIFSDDVDGMYEEFSEGKEVYKSDSIAGKKFAWLFKPSLQSYLNDKDNPLTYKFSFLLGARYETAPGGFIYSRFRFPLYNTTDAISLKTLEPEGTATRTDSLKYMQYNGIQMQDMAIDQTVKLPWNIYGRGEIGYFEPAYGGMDVELYRPFNGGRFGIGVEYQYAKKRQVDDFFGFEKVHFEGKFVNLFANLVPELGIKTTLKAGEFFAGDKGVSWTLMRDFKDFTMGAFITKTSSDVFSAPENKGYMDKGIFLNIPISTISPKYIRGGLNYSLKPWTRDVAQYANQVNSLVGLDPANVFEMRSQIDDFKE